MAAREAAGLAAAAAAAALGAPRVRSRGLAEKVRESCECDGIMCVTH